MNQLNPSMNNTKEKILAILERTFTPQFCQLDDESALHIGHAGAASGGGHFRLRMISTRFEGLNLVSRHRLVYDAVRNLMQSEIHALAITALTPNEANAE